MNLKDALRATFRAQDHNLPDGQKYDPSVCQCCGYLKRGPDSPECVCDGLDWYMIQGGGVECQAHKFARAIGRGKTTFLIDK